MKFKKPYKKVLSLLTSIVITLTTMSTFPVSALGIDESDTYALFAQGTDNSIHIDAEYLCINGDIITNGIFSANTDLSDNQRKYTWKAGK